MTERTYKHNDVATIFGVSRTTAYNWQANPFTAEDIHELFKVQQRTIDREARKLARARKAFEALNRKMDAEEKFANVSAEIPQ